MLIHARQQTESPTAEEVEHLDIPAESSPTPAHPIRVRSRPVPAGVRIARHTHAWAQVACTTRGVLRIAAEGSTWMVPPSRAIWVPPNVTHEVVIVEDAFLRTLYIDESVVPEGLDACRVVEVSPLLREVAVALNDTSLALMADAMHHRGPDGGSTWTSAPGEDGRGCLLAHRRLSILDLSTAADQPMVEPERGNAIVFNGEIYNFLDLRCRLASEGQRFRSSGDTEVLLRGLCAWGRGSVRELRGMYAFAMWDVARRELVLARDPLGIKPLYVARNPDPSGAWSLMFGSEVRAILASGLMGRPRLDSVAVASVVWNGFVMGPGTIVAGISSLWPGELRVVDDREGWSRPSPPRASRCRTAR